jgi:hypothetical protein
LFLLGSLMTKPSALPLRLTSNGYSDTDLGKSSRETGAGRRPGKPGEFKDAD